MKTILLTTLLILSTLIGISQTIYCSEVGTIDRATEAPVFYDKDEYRQTTFIIKDDFIYIDQEEGFEDIKFIYDVTDTDDENKKFYFTNSYTNAVIELDIKDNFVFLYLSKTIFCYKIQYITHK